MKLFNFIPAHLRGLSRRVWLGIFAVALFAGACASIGVAITSQEHAPQPKASAAGSIGQRPTVRQPPSTIIRLNESTSTTVVVPPVRTATLAPSQPVSISIPAIGVHAAIQELGLNANGTLQVPQPGPHYNEAAWCDCSPTPGELGPSVIVGHVDSAAQGPSVFFNLGALEPGDQIIVDRADGIAASFKVTGVRRFPKDGFPTKVVYGNTPDAQLRLITCGGSFDHATGHYVDNIVVFATLEEHKPM